VLRLVLDRPPGPAAADPRTAAPDSPRVPEVGGVSLGDCEHVAKQTSALLDLLDFGNGRYLLEVSSPGLDRQLYRPSDYERFSGRLARITYETAASGDAAASGAPRRRTVVARLGEVRAAHPPAHPPDTEVTLIDDRTGERLTLKLHEFRLARLEVEL
jgi:hypothetical protein